MLRKKGERSKRIVLTGGHAATTAMAVVEELIRRGESGKPYNLYWIGAKSAIEGKKVAPIELSVLPKMGVRYHSIIAGKLHMKFNMWTLPSLFKIPIGFIHAFIILLKIRPGLILSFGGFAAVPVVVAGWLMRIPIIIHEQTSTAGRANKFSSFFASRVALARESSKKYFPERKIKIVGNPVITQVTDIEPKIKLGEPPVILVTCGSRGSRIINKVIVESINKLLKKYRVVHLTGVLDYEEIKKKRESLDDEIKERYEIYDLVDPIMQMDNLYRQADIVIARAGANTVSEIMIIKRPSILIPIFWSYLGEQQKNAKFAERYGIARILDQDKLSTEVLLKYVDNLIDDWKEIVNTIKNKKSLDIGASQRLITLMDEVLNE